MMDPTRFECVNFNLPSDKANAMLAEACKEDPRLIGCTLQRYCRTAAAFLGTNTCSPFSLLATVCASDAPSLNGCRTYAALCRHGSLVRQCANEAPLQYLPSTSELERMVPDLCAEKWVDGCELCEASEASFKRVKRVCEPLAVYSQFCRQVPESPSCSSMLQLCNSTSVPSNLCPPPPTPPPPPPPPPNNTLPFPTWRPYLHFSGPEYIILPFFVARSTLQLALAVIAAFLIATTHELVNVLRIYCEQKWVAVIERSNGVAQITASPIAANNDPSDAETSPTSRVFGRRSTTTGPIDDLDERGPLLGVPATSARSGTLHKVKAVGLDLSIRAARMILRLLSGILFVMVVLLCVTFNVPIIAGVLAGWGSGALFLGNYAVAGVSHGTYE
ncbi:uncharacterized protein SPPG_02503 [Spizellomyces punctatus DAOM BR117]|uniref:Copper transport protein n=1 Tax=Spizellomyces punctatus (strain DAOM BR117) TaxID=645134 RepID=A0A0L0HLK4_SPIPD|nr:uncharacterized protein SPPG_02503 [Spizellomyces punctatus DAOM BR117]KND01997.1 hypothetical protein SPPG_02503 [Spizellomyces punctatus DAOM BR117]|eukprot:XP_016610036.1 hypothetical protein SPPG_02503 [Spizellomyces punctatus DAOM BR117]